MFTQSNHSKLYDRRHWSKIIAKSILMQGETVSSVNVFAALLKEYQQSEAHNSNPTYVFWADRIIKKIKDSPNSFTTVIDGINQLSCCNLFKGSKLTSMLKAFLSFYPNYIDHINKNVISYLEVTPYNLDLNKIIKRLGAGLSSSYCNYYEKDLKVLLYFAFDKLLPCLNKEQLKIAYDFFFKNRCIDLAVQVLKLQTPQDIEKEMLRMLSIRPIDHTNNALDFRGFILTIFDEMSELIPQSIFNELRDYITWHFQSYYWIARVTAFSLIGNLKNSAPELINIHSFSESLGSAFLDSVWYSFFQDRSFEDSYNKKVFKHFIALYETEDQKLAFFNEMLAKFKASTSRTTLFYAAEYIPECLKYEYLRQKVVGYKFEKEELRVRDIYFMLEYSSLQTSNIFFKFLKNPPHKYKDLCNIILLNVSKINFNSDSYLNDLLNLFETYKTYFSLEGEFCRNSYLRLIRAMPYHVKLNVINVMIVSCGNSESLIYQWFIGKLLSELQEVDQHTIVEKILILFRDALHDAFFNLEHIHRFSYMLCEIKSIRLSDTLLDTIIIPLYNRLSSMFTDNCRKLALVETGRKWEKYSILHWDGRWEEVNRFSNPQICSLAHIINTIMITFINLNALIPKTQHGLLARKLMAFIRNGDGICKVLPASYISSNLRQYSRKFQAEFFKVILPGLMPDTNFCTKSFGSLFDINYEYGHAVPSTTAKQILKSFSLNEKNNIDMDFAPKIADAIIDINPVQLPEYFLLLPKGQYSSLLHYALLRLNEYQTDDKSIYSKLQAICEAELISSHYQNKIKDHVASQIGNKDLADIVMQYAEQKNDIFFREGTGIMLP